MHSKIHSYDYHIWSDKDQSASIKDYPQVSVNEDRKINIEFDRLSFGEYSDINYIFRIHIYLYDENKNLVQIFPCNLVFGKHLVPKEEIDIYYLNKNGNYQIIVTDLAGNKEEYNITIKK